MYLFVPGSSNLLAYCALSNLFYVCYLCAIFILACIYVRPYVCLLVCILILRMWFVWVFGILIFWAFLPSFFLCTYVFVKWMLDVGAFIGYLDVWI